MLQSGAGYDLTVNPGKSQVSITGSTKQLKKLNVNDLPTIQFDGTDAIVRPIIKNLPLDLFREFTILVIADS